MNRIASASANALTRHGKRPTHGICRQNYALKNGYAFSTTVSNEQPPPSLSNIRSTILKSALDEVHQLGWTDDALAAATASVRGKSPNVSMSVVGMMNVDDLISFCMDHWNIQLKEDLLKQKTQQNSSQEEKKDEHTQPTTDIDPLEQGIKTRLEYLIPYLQSNRWHEGMALGVRGPSNALQTQRQLQEMVEIIVASSPEHRSLGTPDKMALGAVYVATELHLLTDTSPGYKDTWHFLSARMDDWRGMTSLGVGSFSVGGSAGNALFVASSVASSLAGGLVSLLMNPTHAGGALGLPQKVMEALFQNPQASWGATNDRQAGTHPDDYKVPPQSTGGSENKH